MPLMKELQNATGDLPEYLSRDLTKMKGKLEVTPAMDQIPLSLPINIPLVCEFLAHTA
jgi:hypothetical protein